MTEVSSHGEWHDQAALYVLGALDRPERTAFEAHLATCAECAADVRASASVAQALLQAVPQLTPPSELRDRILTSAGAARSPSPFQANVQTPATRRPAWAWLATAAVLAVAVALGVQGVQLRSRIATLERELTQAQATADASGRAVAESRRTAADAQSAMAVLTAPDVARVDLAGQPVAPTAAARAFWSRSHGLVFTASNLPALPPGRTYQLWVVADSMPISAGLLKPAGDGAASAFFQTPVDLPAPMAMAVTIEPEGGLSAPTGDKYLIGLVTSSGRPAS